MPRQPTHDDRDRRRVYTPPRGVAAQIASPEYVCDDLTGRYEGEELRAGRAARPDDVRFARIEERLDGLDRHYAEVADDLRRIGDKLADCSRDLAAVAAVVQDRGRRPSGPQHKVEDAVEETLAKHVLAERTTTRAFRQRIAIIVITSLLSGGGGFWLLQRLFGGG